MTIEQLQYLCMVAKTRSITLAAENLYVTQQTISKAINKLENELGVLLLERSHKGVLLTEKGEEFVQRANTIVKDFWRLYDDMHFTQEAEIKGEVKVFYNSYIGHTIGPDLLLRFYQEYPLVKLSVEENLAIELLERVKNSDNEMAIITIVNNHCGNGNIEGYRHLLDWEELYSENCFACISRKSPLAKKDAVSLKELVKYPVVWGECPHFEDSLLEEYGLAVNVLISSSNASIQGRAINNNMAVGFSTELINRRGNLYEGDVCYLPIKEMLRLTTIMIKPKGYKLNRLQQLFIEETKRAFLNY